MKTSILSAVVAGSLLAATPDYALAKDPRITGSIAVKNNVTAAEKSSLAKVEQKEANAAALKAYAGKVVKSELDEEDGFLVWEVDVVGRDGAKREILIDAGNSKILRNKRELD